MIRVRFTSRALRVLRRAAVGCICLTAITSLASPRYESAPELIGGYLQNAKTPIVVFNPQRDRMLIHTVERYPNIAGLATPALLMAGLRINPLNNGPRQVNRCRALQLKRLDSERTIDIRIPSTFPISVPEWSPDGDQFAFMRIRPRDVILYLGDGESGGLQHVKDVTLNGALGKPVQWLPDGRNLLCRILAERPDRRPSPFRAPIGPVVEDTVQPELQVARQGSFLQSERDEKLLEYFATSQLAIVNSETHGVTRIGRPEIFSRVQASPDGQYILVSYLRAPYPRDLPVSGFPKRVEIWNREGELVYHLADIPARRNVPVGGVLAAKRMYNWRPTSPAELIWADEPLDGGHPAILVPHRDRIMKLEAPFTGQPEEIVRVEDRLESLWWGEDPHVVMFREYDAERGLFRTYLFNPDDPEPLPEILWARRRGDRYTDPGTPIMRRLPNGQSVMRVYYNSIYLAGDGASPEGERPFLDLFNLTTREVEPIFESDNESYERVIDLLEPDAASIITRKETAGSPPNHYIRRFPDGELEQLTNFDDDFPEMREVHRQMISFQREDGVKMSFVLHLPPDYDVSDDNRERLPTILWVHPRTYAAGEFAGQVRESLRRFPIYKGAVHRFLALQGYAVLDSTTIPVIGDPESANDTFLEQVVSGARAAIDKAVDLGFADPERIGVGGHSYGAFVAVNLMAHTDLFKTGVARSGAYNRTLTPFGFQHERRSLWEAPELYTKLSPLMFANQIQEPVLLIHGSADDNPATAPIQSKWMYQAIQGNGGTARLVNLPHEGHRYEAVQSVGHVAWEMINWFDRHLKPVPELPSLITTPTFDMPEIFIP